MRLEEPVFDEAEHTSSQIFMFITCKCVNNPLVSQEGLFSFNKKHVGGYSCVAAALSSQRSFAAMTAISP